MFYLRRGGGGGEAMFDVLPENKGHNQNSSLEISSLCQLNAASIPSIKNP